MARVFRSAVRRFSKGAGGRSSRGGAIITGANGASLHLPPAESAVTPTYKKAIYCPASQTLYTSTHVGTDSKTNEIVRGRVGTCGSESIIPPEEAKEYARNAGLRLLATINRYLD